MFSHARSRHRRSGRQSSRRSPGSVCHIELLEPRFALTVTYHGGALLPAVEVQGVYLGSAWSSGGNVTQRAQLDAYMGFLVKSPFMDMLTTAGYNVGRGSSSTGIVAPLPTTSTTVTDAQIRSTVQAQITSGAAQTPDANRLYVVFVAPGVTVSTPFGASTNSFLGYHGAFAGRTAAGAVADIRYAVMPYPGPPNPTASSQGFASAFDELTVVTSHEVAEAVTDPDVNYKALGWYDDTLDGEIADLTDLTATITNNGTTYTVQQVVNKNDQPIAPSSTSTPPPPPPTAPVNDAFAAATVVTGTSFSVVGTNVNATKQTGEPTVAGNAGGKSVWWTWTAPAAGTVTLKTAGSSFDTLLGVYTGSIVSSLSPVASNDDASSAVTTSAVTFHAVAGTTYRFVVDGYNAASGSITLALGLAAPTTAPANDAFAKATVITGVPFSGTGTNVGGTKETGEPATVAGQKGGKSVWWSWTAKASGTVKVNTTGSSFDTLLGVYTGSSVSSLKLVAANDDNAAGGVTSALTFHAVAGTTYRIMVDGYNGATGSIVLNLSLGTTARHAATPAIASLFSALVSQPTSEGSPIGGMGFKLARRGGS